MKIESRCPDEVTADLTRRGHEIESVPDWSLGRVCAVGVEPGDGMVVAAASPRGEQAYAVAR